MSRRRQSSGSVRDIFELVAQAAGVDLERDGLEFELGGQTYRVRADADRIDFVLGGGKYRWVSVPAETTVQWWSVLGYSSLEHARKLGPQELRKRHRKLSLKHHPDRPGGDAKKQQMVNDAAAAARAELGW